MAADSDGVAKGFAARRIRRVVKSLRRQTFFGGRALEESIRSKDLIGGRMLVDGTDV